MTRLPATLTTTTRGLLVICDAQNKELFTFSRASVSREAWATLMIGRRSLSPSYLQLLTAPEDEIVRMKQEWELAARKNARLAQRYEFDSIDDIPADAKLPYIPALGEPSFITDLDESAQADCAALEEFLLWIEQQKLRDRCARENRSDCTEYREQR